MDKVHGLAIASTLCLCAGLALLLPHNIPAAYLIAMCWNFGLLSVIAAVTKMKEAQPKDAGTMET